MIQIKMPTRRMDESNISVKLCGSMVDKKGLPNIVGTGDVSIAHF
jgi:hypothetical protein